MPADIIPKNLTTSPTGVPERNNAEKKPDKKFDPFHPEMPSIPGLVDSGSPSPPPATVDDGSSKRSISSNIPRFVQIGGIIAVMVVFAAGVLSWIRHTLRSPKETASIESAGKSSVSDLPPLSALPTIPEGPVVAAGVEELSKPWSFKKFTYVKPVTRESIDAVVVRLPGNSLWAFALREPYGRCELDFVTDLGQIEHVYGYRANHPMVVNPCNRSVYDPLKVGPIDNNTWARGEVVKGIGMRPPISVNVEVRGRSIIAEGIE